MVFKGKVYISSNKYAQLKEFRFYIFLIGNQFLGHTVKILNIGTCMSEQTV